MKVSECIIDEADLDEKGQYTAAAYDRAIAEAKIDADFLFAERAGIMEFDAGMTRREAEVMAAYWMLHGKLPPSQTIPE